eukprot:4469593-Pyramimonas_sp.AAC.1
MRDEEKGARPLDQRGHERFSRDATFSCSLSGQLQPPPQGLRTATRERRSSSGSEPAAAADVLMDPGGDVLECGPSK